MPVTPPPPGLEEEDYERIEAAVMETVRGRWFLAEFARRVREGESQRVLDAVARLERVIEAAVRPAEPPPQAALEGPASAGSAASAAISGPSIPASSIPGSPIPGPAMTGLEVGEMRDKTASNLMARIEAYARATPRPLPPEEAVETVDPVAAFAQLAALPLRERLEFFA